ncbi:MAG: UDP-N-acetylmuramate--L-alanine ligase [Deltaproteobacteria bacterium]|nr:UDP-N-acetylmuramate--L-alanine ligase [Deltaproteobacteria bacterium]
MSLFRSRVCRIHFVGIGGTGMSGIAEVLAAMGHAVSGSDLASNDATRRLVSLGVAVHKGHAAANIAGADVVVRSSAVTEDNPEIAAARKARITVIPRAEMLAEIARLKYSVLVAGAHGKTTTTSLIAEIASHAGLDPTIVIGGRLRSLGANARLGQGEYLVAEADESDGSFLKLLPTVAVVTNIDREHLDHYQTLGNVLAAFTEFLNKVPFYGKAIVCLDCPHVQEIVPRIVKGTVTYGFSAQAEYRATDVRAEGGRLEFAAWRGRKRLGTFSVALTGRHNVLNSLASIAAAEELGVAPEVAAGALSAFKGIHRRYEIVGVEAGVTVVDDYGHHPTEIRATLAGAREGAAGRVVVAFQPHRHTRTFHLFDEFVTAFNDADVLLLADIYAAGERPIEGVSARRLCGAIAEHGHGNVRYVGRREQIAAELAAVAKNGDTVLTLGAGDIWKTGRELLDLLRAGGRGE